MTKYEIIEELKKMGFKENCCHEGLYEYEFYNRDTLDFDFRGKNLPRTWKKY